MLLMIDNYDSFTYNLVQYFGELGEDVRVVRNDAAGVAALAAMHPDRVCVSPGPCSPKEAGVSLEAIKYFAGKVPVFGVCLGHQAIGEAFGGTIVRAKRLMHGKTDVITADGKSVFAGLPEKITVARYHSLVIDRTTCPACLEISAVSDDGEIQGVRHKELMVEGVQFHPESVASEYGHEMLANFLKMTGGTR